jgi:aspartyl/glutamyl-tRNA(Asn/Gln) amidotransferase C subunit
MSATTLITPQTTQRIAFLARLSNNDLTGAELEKFTTDLSAILTHVEEIKNVDTGQTQALDGWRTISIEELREDEAEQDEARYNRVKENIKNNFPHKERDLLVVPGIFDND